MIVISDYRSAEWDTITEEDKNKCDLRTVDDGEFW